MKSRRVKAGFAMGEIARVLRLSRSPDKGAAERSGRGSGRGRRRVRAGAEVDAVVACPLEKGGGDEGVSVSERWGRAAWWWRPSSARGSRRVEELVNGAVSRQAALAVVEDEK